MAEIREGTEIGHAATWGYVLARPRGDNVVIATSSAISAIAWPTREMAEESATFMSIPWTVCALIPVALLDPAIDKDSDALDEITGGAA